MMKTPYQRARRLVLAAALVAPSPLVLSACGDTSSGPPKDVTGLKTPSDILKEAKAQEKAANP